jgi:parallel beta-helix repeat protein
MEPVTVYISVDGSVEPQTAPLQRNGDAYTLTSNLLGGIKVQKSYVTLNGAGYTIAGNGKGTGVDLGNGVGQDPSRTPITNVTVTNLKIVNCTVALGSENTYNNTFVSNYIENCDTGFWITGSANNTLYRNTIKNCTTGISINYGSSSNIIVENNILSSYSVWLSPDPVVDRNYWGDYTTRFPNAKEIGNSGIWDTPYSHGDKIIDYHPLTNQVNLTTFIVTKWIRDVGSFSLGIGNALIQTADGGYAIAGAKDGGFLLLKFGSSGEVLWEKTYGTEAKFASYASALVETDDGGYVLAGSGTPWPNFIGPNGTLFNLLKTDSAGNILWTRNFSTQEKPFFARSLIKTSDGGYAVAGYSEVDHTIMSSGTGYVHLIKTDDAGNIVWEKQFEADATWASVHISAVETKDGGYALLSIADFTTQDIPTVENVDFWLIKTDPEGQMQWNKTYGDAYNDRPSCFIETVDGGFLLAGSTSQKSDNRLQDDAWLVKLDSEGNMQWNKTYGNDGEDNICSVLESQDGGYIVAASIDVSSEHPPSGALIFKIDTSGKTEWTAEYQGITQPAIKPLQIIETEDNMYVFAGFKPRADVSEPLAMVLVKFKGSGLLPAVPEFPAWATALLFAVGVAAIGIISFKRRRKPNA